MIAVALLVYTLMPLVYLQHWRRPRPARVAYPRPRAARSSSDS